MFKQEIIDWLSEMNIKNYSLRADLTVDVDGSVFLFNRNLEVIPVQFGVVKGNFNCSRNNLKSLEGCPQSVGSSFYCSKNNLKSLEGCPRTVEGNFYCWNNNLESLEGSPQTVGGHFDCSWNDLKSLEGSPKTVGGHFDCFQNKLKSLQYLPEIKGELRCDDHLKESEEYCKWKYHFIMNQRNA